ncbi:MAG: glycosyltransferase family 39 protein [Candidatus Doudnabacteria bacterium]|nr:glycosyltransferase family 39 protein [Candidatus Doudnabacteria bacterium]
MSSKIAILSTLLASMFLGGLIRYANFSDYKFYPDGYQNLIVAENIRTYGSASGTLGEGGGFYPPFIEWTRPVYPILIDAVDLITSNKEQAAKAVNFALGILSIPLAYFLARKVSGSNVVGVLVALLLSISFNHVAWGGFILTEVTGVFVLLLLLFITYTSVNKASDYLQWQDLLAGVVFAISLFTRYEYSILILPVLYLVYSYAPNPWKYLLNFLTGFLFVLGLMILWLGPWPYGIEPILHVVINKWWVVALFAALILLLKLFRPSALLQSKVILGILIMFVLLMIADSLGTGILPLKGIISFAKTDFSLFILAFAGFIFLHLKRNYEAVVFFGLSVLLLSAAYYQTNPSMQRYWTHIIPFLLIPAAFMLDKFVILARQNKLFILVPVCLLSAQAYTSNIGSKQWDNGIWMKSGYEEVAARKVQKITSREGLLIVSYPEPYYFYSGIPTHSVADVRPYLFIDDSLNNKNVYVVIDMGMRDYFPEFTKFIETNFRNKKVLEFFVDAEYRRRDLIIPENAPVGVYVLNLGELKQTANK